MNNIENIEDLVTKCEAEMIHSVDFFKNNLKGIRAGRASVDILNPVSVDLYGNKTRITHCANVTILEDGRTLKIEPWDHSALSNIKKAIANTAGLDLNPIAEGKSIKVVVPALTQERREKLSKLVDECHHKVKDSINQVRRKYMSPLKKPDKDLHIAQDNKDSLIKKMQNITDKYINIIDNISKEKKIDIMKV